VDKINFSALRFLKILPGSCVDIPSGQEWQNFVPVGIFGTSGDGCPYADGWSSTTVFYQQTMREEIKNGAWKSTAFSFS
jgi:hypothetical protein